MNKQAIDTSDTSISQVLEQSLGRMAYAMIFFMLCSLLVTLLLSSCGIIDLSGNGNESDPMAVHSEPAAGKTTVQPVGDVLRPDLPDVELTR